MTKQNELFLKLLSQIKFPTTFADQAVLQKGLIEDVEVYSAQRKWKIHVFFDTPLQFSTYQALRQALSHEFSDLVDVELLIKTKQGDDQYLLDYWPYVVSHSQLALATREFLFANPPTKRKERWLVSAPNQIATSWLTHDTLLDLGMAFREYGFFNLKFVTQLDESKLEENEASLKAAQRQHAANMQQYFESQPTPARKTQRRRQNLIRTKICLHHLKQP